MAPKGWQGDVFSLLPSNETHWTEQDATYDGPHFMPSDAFNDTIANGSVYPGQLPTFFGCVCNCSYVSYMCCDSKDGMVYESPESNLGHLEGCIKSNPTLNTASYSAEPSDDPQFVEELTTVATQSTSATSSTIESPSATHRVCKGYCYGAARSCSWSHTGDCTCSAPKNEILFWMSSPCIATAQNPNKQHDMQKRETAYAPGSDKTGPYVDPDREIGACNSSYVSYACAYAADGIVHEPRANWLGAMLPPGVTEYPPIPQQFLDIHGIKGTPNLGLIDLPYWS